MPAAQAAAEAEGCALSHRALARFSPVAFNPSLVAKAKDAPTARQLSVRRMRSRADHDAQMFAPNCPSAMIFVPSSKGLRHNIHEHSEEVDLVARDQVLLDVVLDISGAQT